MPTKSTVERAKHDLAEGKRPTTAAGEFVREEMEHVRRGRHGARSPQQGAIKCFTPKLLPAMRQIFGR